MRAEAEGPRKIVQLSIVGGAVRGDRRPFDQRRDAASIDPAFRDELPQNAAGLSGNVRNRLAMERHADARRPAERDNMGLDIGTAMKDRDGQWSY